MWAGGSTLITKELKKAARALRGAKHAIALTGAGISVESGIPDFRSPGGLWTKYPPDEFATIDAFHANPARVWGLWRELGASLAEVVPNPAHEALAALEEQGRIGAVITQNIDNLHQRAGSQKVIEYHGNAGQTFCLKCHRRAPLDLATLPEGAPACACGGLLKPDVVMFGELIPAYALMESQTLTRRADVVLIVGTSAQVFPAAGLPYAAKDHGATIIECNIEPTEFTRRITDIFLEGRAGVMLPELLRVINESGDA